MTRKKIHVIRYKFSFYLKWIHALIPSTSALQALVNLAQTGSITRTAAEMRLTQSAISHKIKALEGQLGFALLDRDGRGVRLTHRARQYVAEVGPALEVLTKAGDRSELTGSLTLNIAPGFAANWLAPRLSRFVASHPGLAVTINTPRGYGDLGRRRDDIYVSFLTPDQAPRGARHLMDVAFFPVAAPGLTGGGRNLSPDEVLALPLLHLDGRKDWAAWSKAAGALGGQIPDGVVFQDMQIMAAAARAGQGAALGDALTSATALERGELVRLHPFEWHSPRAYWLIAGDTPSSDGKGAFEEWVLHALGRQPAGNSAIGASGSS